MRGGKKNYYKKRLGKDSLKPKWAGVQLGVKANVTNLGPLTRESMSLIRTK